MPDADPRKKRYIPDSDAILAHSEEFIGWGGWLREHIVSDAVSVPDRRESVADRVAAEILKLIAGGDIEPGSNLPAERKLSVMLGVSRVSVRAALQTLKAQGFIDAVRGGGTRVVCRASGADPALAELVRLDRSNMLDLMDLRCEIEVWAARRAAESMTPETVSMLRETVVAMTRPGADKAAQDVAFHMALAKASDSVVYRHLLSLVRGTLAEMLTYHRTELFASAQDDATVVAQHIAIVEAIEAKDSEGAARAMREHLNWARDHYSKSNRDR